MVFINPKSNPNLSKLIKNKSIQPINNKKSYVQTSKINIENIIYIKNVFLNTSSKKIVEINNIINISSLVKLRIKMTMKELSRKQVIISISKINANIIGSNTSFHMNAINKCFKKTNLNTLAKFINVEKVSIIVITNQATSV